MLKIALSGNIGSGKSTIAKEFEKKEYYLLSYTQRIKEEVASAMQATGVVESKEEALRKFQEHKELYRPLLISWADCCGWSDGSRLKGFLQNLDKENVVLDNLRYIAQANIVKQAGFITIRLEGGNRVDVPSERSLDNYPFDLTIPWMENVGKRIEYILQLLPNLKK